MKKEKAATKTKGELEKALVEKREELRKFNFSVFGGGAKNVKAGRETRKEIARILSALNGKLD